MRAIKLTTAIFLLALPARAEAQGSGVEGVTWLVEYDGRGRPDEPTWAAKGRVKAETVGSALRIVDDSDQDESGFRAGWRADPSAEVVVEFRVRAERFQGVKGGRSVWPWRDGAPIGVLVSDGRHQQGLLLAPNRVGTFTDRAYEMDTTDGFHDYRLVIRGTDMSVSVDGERRIVGENAFCKPADSAEPFLQFGSTSKAYAGDALWESVRLGVRKASAGGAPNPVRVTVGEPWTITRTDGVRQTRPYVDHLGGGLLLMSVGQGPDKAFEPYGALRSADAGRTWTSIEGLDQKTFAPQPALKLREGGALGVSRWNMKYVDGHFVGMAYRFDDELERYTMYETKILLPGSKTSQWMFFRHMFQQDDGSLLASGVDATRESHLLRSTDLGHTWEHYASIALGGEPALARLSDDEYLAIIKKGSMLPLRQTRSDDGGKTWSPLELLEEASVNPDLEVMSNGLIACSYGRPASNLMFSADRGRTWTSHHVIFDKPGFNFNSVREVRPGRLLYVADVGTIQAVYIDVERTDR